MITDYEQRLTPAAGQLFDGDPEYGSHAYDMKGAGSPGRGEPLYVWGYAVDADSDVGTSLDFKLVGDDDGAGTNEVELTEAQSIPVADMTTAAGAFLIGIVDPGAAERRYLRVKVGATGSVPTAGKIAVYLAKGGESLPQNDGVTIGKKSSTTLS